MILESFSCRIGDWQLDEIKLFPATLLVGSNSTGKTRSVTALRYVSEFITGKDRPFSLCEAHFVFRSINGSRIGYSFLIKRQEVVSESLVVDGKTIVDRNGERALFDGQEVTPPADKLLIQVRRDVTLYPAIEEIIGWAAGSAFVNFGKRIVHDNRDESLSRNADMLQEFDASGLKAIAADMNALGFNIERISPVGSLNLVRLREAGVPRVLFEMSLSDGMRRTLSLLIRLHFMARSGCPSLLSIDDIGEGLDYRRSTQLGRFVYDFCLDNGIQLLLTTNDNFQMKIIPMDCWNILYRDGQRVSALNVANDEALFERLTRSSLNNFDLYTSSLVEDAIERHMRDK